MNPVGCCIYLSVPVSPNTKKEEETFLFRLCHEGKCAKSDTVTVNKRCEDFQRNSIYLQLCSWQKHSRQYREVVLLFNEMKFAFQYNKNTEWAMKKY